jgi:putative two-component system response regulator
MQNWDSVFNGIPMIEPVKHGKMTVLAVGENKSELEVLTSTSGLHPCISYLECGENCREVLDRCRDAPVDIVILEAGGNGDILGVDLAKQIQQLDEDIHVIFVADTKRHVWPAFDTGAIAYHPRPLEASRLVHSLTRAQEHDNRLYRYALWQVKKECVDYFYPYGEYLQLVEHIRSQSLRVANHARSLLKTAKEQGLCEEYDIESVVQAIQNHDIGKEHLYPLLKKAYLTKRDRFAIMQHTTLGYNHWMTASTQCLEMDRQHCVLSAEAALTHHECWNGSGYPQGLRGTEIPFVGRVCGICIEYDRMISDLGYMPEQARAVIRQEGENLFDPSLAELFADDLV